MGGPIVTHQSPQTWSRPHRSPGRLLQWEGRQGGCCPCVGARHLPPTRLRPWGPRETWMQGSPVSNPGSFECFP